MFPQFSVNLGTDIHTHTHTHIHTYTHTHIHTHTHTDQQLEMVSFDSELFKTDISGEISILKFWVENNTSTYSYESHM